MFRWVAVTGVSGGYDVVLKNTSAGLYSVWSVDSSGNYVKDLVSNVAGTSGALESFENVFHQDINGDGVIGLVGIAVDTAGLWRDDRSRSPGFVLRTPVGSIV